jgi:hypothetical protein
MVPPTSTGKLQKKMHLACTNCIVNEVWETILQARSPVQYVGGPSTSYMVELVLSQYLNGGLAIFAEFCTI